MKKLTALVLALVMVLAMGSVAFAEPTTPTYSITVNNSSNSTVSIVGKTYTAYKLFDVTYTGSAVSDPHAYSIDSDGDGTWAWDTIKGSLKAGSTTVYENTTYGLTFTPTAADPTVYSVASTMTTDQARSLANALQPIVTGSSAPTVAGSVHASAETATISLNEPGYFVVYGTVKANDPSDGSKELVAAVALTTADPSETVIPKVEAPTLDKKITGEHKLDEAGKAATAQIGATVSFELDSKVPDLTGYADYTFTITDTMTSGLDYTGTDAENAINGLVLKINNVEKTLGTDYTIAHTVGTRTFTLTIPYSTLLDASKGQDIVVTYSAVINNTALTTDFEKNTAKLTYSNNPYNNTTNDTDDHEVYVIDVDINVDKVATSTTGNKLANAKFKVFKGSTEPDADASSWYKFDTSNNVVTWVTKTAADEFVTGSDGKFTPSVRGLEAEATGTEYGLLETEAPDGYNLLDAPVIVTLTAAYSEGSTGKTVTVTATNASVSNGTITINNTQSADVPLATAQVINNAGTELPSTGGIGTTIFYAVGGLMVLGAAIILVSRRKAEAR